QLHPERSWRPPWSAANTLRPRQAAQPLTAPARRWPQRPREETQLGGTRRSTERLSIEWRRSRDLLVVRRMFSCRSRDSAGLLARSSKLNRDQYVTRTLYVSTAVPS